MYSIMKHFQRKLSISVDSAEITHQIYRIIEGQQNLNDMLQVHRTVQKGLTYVIIFWKSLLTKHILRKEKNDSTRQIYSNLIMTEKNFRLFLPKFSTLFQIFKNEKLFQSQSFLNNNLTMSKAT